MAETLEALRQQYEAARVEAAAAHAGCRELDRREFALALAIFEAEGRSHIPAAEWIRAHLAGDQAACAAISAAHPRLYCLTPAHREETFARAAAEEDRESESQRLALQADQAAAEAA